MLLGLSAYNSSSSEEEEEISKEIKKPVKKPQKKKISIPKADYHSSDEDEPTAKKPNLANSAHNSTSLFSKLPAPRNTIGVGKQANRPLIPHVFTKKPSASKTAATAQPKKQPTICEDADSSDDEEGVNFFTFEDKKDDKIAGSVDKPTSTVSPPFTSVANPHLTEPSTNYNQTPLNPQLGYVQPVNEVSHTSHTQLAQPSNFEQTRGNTAGLNPWDQDERFKRMQGRRNRLEKVEFIDMNADSALEGNKELLLQQISEEKNLNRQSHSKKNSNAPSQQSKRKHQLPYLIHQAKEREIELKNAWAAGNAARQAVRNRYGF